MPGFEDVLQDPRLPLAISLWMAGRPQPISRNTNATVMEGMRQTGILQEAQRRRLAQEQQQQALGRAGQMFFRGAPAIGGPQSEALGEIFQYEPNAALGLAKALAEREQQEQSNRLMQQILPMLQSGQLTPEQLLALGANPAIPSGTRQMLGQYATHLRTTESQERQQRNWEQSQARQADQFNRSQAGIAARHADALSRLATKEDRPMSVTDLGHFVDRYGNSPPYGTTPAEVMRSGQYRQVNTQLANTVPSIKSAYKTLRLMEGLSDRIFANEDLIARIGRMGEQTWQRFAQDDPAVSRFISLSRGTLATIIRSLGEKGTLAEGDVRRAEQLLPNLYPPDKLDVAKAKIQQIREIIGASGIEEEPQSGSGWTAEQERRYQELKRKQRGP
jgi:hypothetical protein